MTAEGARTDAVAASLEQRLLGDAYRSGREPFWDRVRMEGGDGYDVVDAAEAHGWSAIPVWGRDGWDLGSWPLVVVCHRSYPDVGYELAYYVEGDVDTYRYPSRDLRDAATDALAFWRWREQDKHWVSGISRVDDAPAQLRGPFSWTRLDESKEEK